MLDIKKVILWVHPSIGDDRGLPVDLKKDFGVDIIAAKDGKEAFSMFVERKPNLVLISDLNLRKMNGVELLQQIMEYDNKAKVIIFTDEDDPEVIEECKELGAFQYLVWPLGKDVVDQSIYVALNDED